jgi:hypothetical protein
MPSGENRSADPSAFRVLLIASLVSSLIMLDSNIVAVSLPAIGRSLGASFTDVQWVISAYVLTYASLLLASGSYADLFGRKKSMLIGLVVFALSSTACGLAQSSFILNLARAAQGRRGRFPAHSLAGHPFEYVHRECAQPGIRFLGRQPRNRARGGSGDRWRHH